MTESEVYKEVLSDIKKEPFKPLTQLFYQNLEGIRKDIVDLDSKHYYSKGNNNLSKLCVKYPKESDNSIKYIKKNLKQSLYMQYISMFGL